MAPSREEDVAPPGHAVQGDVIVNALEIRRAVAVVIGHNLFADEIGVADGAFVQVTLEPQFVFHIRHHGKHVALPVGTHGRSQAYVEDVRSGLGCRAAGRHKQPVRIVAVIMQHQFGPVLAQRADKFGHEARRANAAHVFKAENNMARSLPGVHAHDVAHHAQDRFCNVQIMGNVKAPGPGEGNGRLENNVGARHDHVGNGPHVFNMVEEIKTAHHLVVITNHLAGFAHQIARLWRVAQHVGGTDQELFEGLGRKTLFHSLASLKGYVMLAIMAT